jgi:hypothetical protein
MLKGFFSRLFRTNQEIERCPICTENAYLNVWTNQYLLSHNFSFMHELLHSFKDKCQYALNKGVPCDRNELDILLKKQQHLLVLLEDV